jgi:Cdc6-like AAA superfamily ATPase
VGVTVDADQKNKILNWLTPIDYGPQQSDFISRRQEGTGQWMLGSNEFQGWLNQSNRTLLCPGKPGVGKTIITSIVIHHLDTKFRNDCTVGIAYIYCNFQRQQEQKPANLLLSLLKQLVQEQLSIPDNIKALYTHHEGKRTRPSLGDISKELQAVISNYSRTFIVVDALDELQISEGGPRMLLLEIFKLQAMTGANFFATSRINDEIAELFEGAVSLQIRATDEDVERYLDGQMPLLQPDNLGDDIRDMIKRDIIKAVDGM